MSREVDDALRALESGEISRRDFMLRTFAAGVTLTSASALVRAVEASGGTEVLSSASIKRGGTLVIGTTPASTIDPHQLFDPGGRAVVQTCGNYLVRVGGDLVVRPELATSWNSKDAKTWTVKLRKGVKFHNGQELTSQDVVATYDRLVDPKRESQAKSAFPFLKKGATKAIDRYTVRFNLDRAVADFTYSMFTYQSAILPANWPGDFAKNPWATGPFKLTRYVPKQYAEFERNPDYFESDAPYLDKVRIVFFKDMAAAVAALQSGSVHYLQDVPLDQLPAIKAAGRGIKLLAAPSSSYPQLAMRVDTKPFDNKLVRQAIAWTIDRSALVNNLFQGFATVGNDHLIAPVYPLAKAVRLTQRKPNIAKAKQLLAQAGYPDGIDIELRTHALFSIDKFAQALVEMAKPAGIRIDLKVEPSDIYYQHWNTVPFAMEAWVHRPSPSQLLNLGYLSTAPWNVPHMKSAKFDAMVSALDRELIPAKRRKLAQQIASFMWDEVPAIIAYFYKTTRAIRSNVMGVKPDPTDFIDVRRAWLS